MVPISDSQTFFRIKEIYDTLLYSWTFQRKEQQNQGNLMVGMQSQQASIQPIKIVILTIIITFVNWSQDFFFKIQFFHPTH